MVSAIGIYGLFFSSVRCCNGMPLKLAIRAEPSHLDLPLIWL